MDYTQNLHLPQWEADDRLMMDDFNDAMQSIDTALAVRKELLCSRALQAPSFEIELDLSCFDLSKYRKLQLVSFVSADATGGKFGLQIDDHAESGDYSSDNGNAAYTTAANHITLGSSSSGGGFVVCDFWPLPNGHAAYHAKSYYCAALPNANLYRYRGLYAHPLHSAQNMKVYAETQANEQYRFHSGSFVRLYGLR